MVQISAVLLLLLLPSVQCCSRLLSRRVRSFLEEEVFPPLQSRGFSPLSLPPSCALSPSHDLFLPQEQHKYSYSPRDIKCQYCGKHFKSEMYIDRHFDNKHADKLESNRTTCLADLCPLFGCSEDNTHYRGSGSRLPSAFAKHQSCSQDEVERNVYKCEALSRRCFGQLDDESSGGIRMMDYFNENICKRLHCDNGVLRGRLVDNFDEENEVTVFFTVIRWIMAFLVFGAIMIYACSNGTLSSFIRSFIQPNSEMNRIGPRQPSLLKRLAKKFTPKKD